MAHVDRGVSALNLSAIDLITVVCTQKDAWKSGHKQKCDILGVRYKGYQECMKMVNEAHSRGGGVMHGVELYHESDYRMIPVVFGMPADICERLGEPSIRFFILLELPGESGGTGNQSTSHAMNLSLLEMTTRRKNITGNCSR